MKFSFYSQFKEVAANTGPFVIPPTGAHGGMQGGGASVIGLQMIREALVSEWVWSSLAVINNTPLKLVLTLQKSNQFMLTNA